MSNILKATNILPDRYTQKIVQASYEGIYSLWKMYNLYAESRSVSIVVDWIQWQQLFLYDYVKFYKSSKIVTASNLQ